MKEFKFQFKGSIYPFDGVGLYWEGDREDLWRHLRVLNALFGLENVLSEEENRPVWVPMQFSSVDEIKRIAEEYGFTFRESRNVTDRVDNSNNCKPLPPSHPFWCFTRKGKVVADGLELQKAEGRETG